MDDEHKVIAQLAALADHFFARRTAILDNWHHAVDDDPALATASTLARREFFDHIPAALDAFEQILRARYLAQKSEAAKEHKAHAAEHGLHRWHHGYNQQDVMREWGHLHLCLVNELENYAAMNRDLEDDVLPVARRVLVQLCSNGVTESAMRFAELQQIEATGRIRDLEQALEEIKVLEQSRGETWRRALHDVRGNFGVIKNISDQLQDGETEEALKAEFMLLLQKSVGSLHTLLNNLLVLSKLDAGQEQRNLQNLDAASVLRTLCDSFQPFALARGLFLHTEGPASLPVQGDTINIQRIAQNLILNALKYTGKGGVTVSWEALETEGVQRWAFSVEDTGPGIQSSMRTPLAHAIEESTPEAAAVEQSPNELAPPTDASENIFQPAPLFSRRSVPQSQGEGVGLSIVKRLCELLDATLELKTEPGQGSVFRVVLPSSYAAN